MPSRMFTMYLNTLIVTLSSRLKERGIDCVIPGKPIVYMDGSDLPGYMANCSLNGYVSADVTISVDDDLSREISKEVMIESIGIQEGDYRLALGMLASDVCTSTKDMLAKKETHVQFAMPTIFNHSEWGRTPVSEQRHIVIPIYTNQGFSRLAIRMKSVN